ncbi:hypothetical protein TNCT_358491 [Trichonephila clavata]|uniref:Uncharacterized protein n=1 Tax=Trichonephila clavata TaxID=2740835 RepID=A0A8X6KP33_TRICU|nr:hypothetical protein TNCT_358491 [Trichonephila clavata]
MSLCKLFEYFSIEVEHFKFFYKFDKTPTSLDISSQASASHRFYSEEMEKIRLTEKHDVKTPAKGDGRAAVGETITKEESFVTVTEDSVKLRCVDVILRRLVNAG